MSIQHTVVFRLWHDVDSVEEREFIDAARSSLAAIPGVQGFTVMRQVSAKSDLTWQFSMSFEDQGAYDSYNAHPAHLSFVAVRWACEVADLQEYDFVDA